MLHDKKYYGKGKPENKPHLSFERQGGKWLPNELTVAMPMKDFEAEIANILKSNYGSAEVAQTKTASVTEWIWLVIFFHSLARALSALPSVFCPFLGPKN